MTDYGMIKITKKINVIYLMLDEYENKIIIVCFSLFEGSSQSIFIFIA